MELSKTTRLAIIGVVGCFLAVKYYQYKNSNQTYADDTSSTEQERSSCDSARHTDLALENSNELPKLETASDNVLPNCEESLSGNYSGGAGQLDGQNSKATSANEKNTVPKLTSCVPNIVQEDCGTVDNTTRCKESGSKNSSDLTQDRPKKTVEHVTDSNPTTDEATSTQVTSTKQVVDQTNHDISSALQVTDEERLVISMREMKFDTTESVSTQPAPTPRRIPTFLSENESTDVDREGKAHVQDNETQGTEASVKSDLGQNNLDGCTKAVATSVVDDPQLVPVSEDHEPDRDDTTCVVSSETHQAEDSRKGKQPKPRRKYKPHWHRNKNLNDWRKTSSSGSSPAEEPLRVKRQGRRHRQSKSNKKPKMNLVPPLKNDAPSANKSSRPKGHLSTQPAVSKHGSITGEKTKESRRATDPSEGSQKTGQFGGQMIEPHTDCFAPSNTNDKLANRKPRKRGGRRNSRRQKRTNNL